MCCCFAGGEQKERDLELAARIGQSLLKQNRELTARNRVLDDQLETTREEVSSSTHASPTLRPSHRKHHHRVVIQSMYTVHLVRWVCVRSLLQIAQLRHELSMRDDLLQFYAGSEEVEGSEAQSLWVYTHTQTHAQPQTRMHTHARTHAQTETQTHVHACMHTHTHTHTQTHAHTHTQTHARTDRDTDTHAWGHGGSVRSTVASQQEGCGFKSRIVKHVGACSRAFLCGVCMFSPCSPGFPP